MARGIAKRGAKLLLKLMGCLVATALGLLALVLLVLVIPALRAFAVEQGIAYANRTLDGYTIAIERVDRLDPWGVKARGIRLLDPQRRQIVEVPWLRVQLEPFALMRGTVRLERIEVDGARVQLFPADAPEDEPPQEPASEPSTFTIRVDHVRIRDAALLTDWSGRSMHARVGTLAGGGQWGTHPMLALEQANLRVTADGDELLRLRTTEGSWDAERGGRVGVEAMLAGAPLTLQASVPALAEAKPWPVERAALRLQRVTRRSLALLGIEDGAQLNTALDLTIDLSTHDRRLDAVLELRAGESRVAIDASADEDAYELALRLPPSRLSDIAGTLPAMKLGVALRARGTPGYVPERTPLTPREVALSWRDLEIDEGTIPAGRVQLELPLPLVRLVEISLEGMEHALAASAEYDTQRGRGQLALDLHQLELNRIDLLQRRGVAGLFDGGVSARFGPHSLSASGDIRVLEFAHPSASLDELALAFAVQGTPEQPRGTLQLRAARVKVGDLELDSIRSEARATANTIEAQLHMLGPDSWLAAGIDGHRTGEQLHIAGSGLGMIAKKELRFELRELAYDPRRVSVEELSLSSGKQAVHLRGALDEQRGIDAQLRLIGIDLAEWTALAGVEGVAGTLQGQAHVGGTTDQPRVDTTLSLRGARYRSDVPVDARLRARADLATRHAELALHMQSADELGAKRAGKKQMRSREPLAADVELAIDLPSRPRDLARAAEHARVAAKVDAHLPVEPLSLAFGDALAGLDGVLDLKLNAKGTLDDPDLQTELRARLKLPEEEGAPREAVRLTAKLTKQQAELALWTGDEAGQLLTLNGFVVWPGGSPRAAFEQPARWQSTRFKLQADLSPRRLDLYQGVFAYFSKLYARTLPLRVGGKFVLEGDGGRLDGSAQAQAVVFGDKLDGRCKLGTEAAVDLDARLQADQVTAEVTVQTDGGGTLRAKLDSHLALDALNGAQPAVGPARIELQAKDIAIYKLPGLCNLADGRASFTLAASGLGQQRPALQLKGTIANLKAPGSEPMTVDTQVRVAGSTAELHAQLAGERGQLGNLDARLGLAYPDGTTPAVSPAAPIDARVRLDRLPLANVLAFTEAVGNVRGSASADLSVRGKLGDPEPAGHLELQNAHMTIAKLAQPLHDLNGRVEVKGRSLKIRKLTARDRDGKLRAEGFASLAHDLSGEAGLYLEADKFPLRQQGTIIGELTTRARLDLKLARDLQATAQLKILDGRVWLTGERGKQVQSLDPHPHVRFSDAKVEHEATPAEEKAAGKQGFALQSFKIRTERALWLQHEDFSMQVGVAIDLAQRDGAPELTGEASIQRGELKLLGKIFKLEKDSAIRFTGPVPPDPELDIKATYEPPTGEPLIVEVTGQGSAPVLAFSGAATNVGEAVAVLTGRGDTAGQGGQGDPATAMAKVASSMTAGLLVMTARREFGDWIPMITVETGESGQPTSARAGFDASKLIPEWLEGFAKGAYVEGIVGAGGAAGGRAGVGVRLEVALPRDFVTTLGLGPNSAWSADVAWAP